MTTPYPAILTFDVHDDPDGEMAQSIVLACNNLKIPFTWKDGNLVVHIETPNAAFKLGIEHVFWLRKLNETA